LAVLPALVDLAAVALLAVLLLAAGFDFAVDFVADDFAAGFAFLLTSLASPLESASITMDGAALEAALDEAVLGEAALG
jgi:hypothetical protein